jgi:hypothetical protein
MASQYQLCETCYTQPANHGHRKCSSCHQKSRRALNQPHRQPNRLPIFGQEISPIRKPENRFIEHEPYPANRFVEQERIRYPANRRPPVINNDDSDKKDQEIKFLKGLLNNLMVGEKAVVKNPSKYKKTYYCCKSQGCRELCGDVQKEFTKNQRFMSGGKRMRCCLALGCTEKCKLAGEEKPQQGEPQEKEKSQEKDKPQEKDTE